MHSLECTSHPTLATDHMTNSSTGLPALLLSKEGRASSKNHDANRVRPGEAGITQKQHEEVLRKPYNLKPNMFSNVGEVVARKRNTNTFILTKRRT